MGLPALLADYLFVAPLLAARLAQQIPDVEAEVVETTEQMLAADNREAVLLVMWAGDAVGARAGANQQLTQRWVVVLALNNVGALPDARQVRAGATLSLIHKAVVGWAPAGAVHAFQRTNSPMRPDIRQTKALYPLAFDIELSL